MKKKEIYIFTGIFLLAIFLWIGLTLWNHFRNFTGIRITVEGSLFGTYSLSEDQVISVGSGNICEIRDGQVKMIYADCPDKLCTRQPAVDKNGGSIVCLPHQVVIEGISSDDASGLQVDAIS